MSQSNETNGASRMDVAVTLQAVIPAAQDDVFRFVSAKKRKQASTEVTGVSGRRSIIVVNMHLN